MSFGGGGAILADMEHQAVALHGWTSAREFADLFAISRVAPGPGTMLSAMIGWKVAGWPGAVAAAAALYFPSSLATYAAGRAWRRWRGSNWHRAVEGGLAPIAAGLILAGGLAVLRAAPGGWPVWAATAAASAALLAWPRLHPLVVMLAGGALFGLALVW
jgi:chromate transporter